MAGTQEKIQLLLRIAHRLNEAHIEWALGASMLLYFKGITSGFHDIDLMVADCDAECVRTILSEMGENCPSDPIPSPMYRTKTFMEFLIDSVEVDVMAGFAIVKDGKVYDCALRKEQIVEKMRLGTEVIPLQSPLLWCKYYRLMGRDEKPSKFNLSGDASAGYDWKASSGSGQGSQRTGRSDSETVGRKRTTAG